jgi:orotate phosphoribosyltransferase-like protein
MKKMTDLNLTRHAAARMRQRGLRDADISVLLDIATRLVDDAWLVTDADADADADADREIAQRKREIERLQRLRGCKFVLSDDALVTVCHMRKAPARRALRKGRASR